MFLNVPAAGRRTAAAVIKTLYLYMDEILSFVSLDIAVMLDQVPQSRTIFVCYHIAVPSSGEPGRGQVFEPGRLTGSSA